ncbi:alpha/beta fold hydrolase [Pseudomonas sp. ML96]|uniref:alpha/beta fold hydrolase n=1 Tax=Pseudomonas sp. ML96 TaxID=1523503 RepID=UPI0009DF1625|nr:alpha/beta hydrolase [Pseudomonas sp. ML96]
MKLTKLVTGIALSIAAAASSWAGTTKPTIVLVHGAFADSSSWNGVTQILESDGYTVIAAANPLRSLKGDAQSIDDLLQSLKSPAVLVGHSYGGAVISNAAYDQVNVKALVYVAAFAPDMGESAIALSGMFPGSTLGPTLAPPVALSSGANDLYIQQDKFHNQFAADVPSADAKLMAVAQRPVTDAALNEVPTEVAWRKIPSWWVYGDADKNIPPQAMKFMAERAKSRETLVIEGGSHVVMISHPEEVARLIESAANAN